MWSAKATAQTRMTLFRQADAGRKYALGEALEVAGYSCLARSV